MLHQSQEGFERKHRSRQTPFRFLSVSKGNMKRNDGEENKDNLRSLFDSHLIELFSFLDWLFLLLTLTDLFIYHKTISWDKSYITCLWNKLLKSFILIWIVKFWKYFEKEELNFVFQKWPLKSYSDQHSMIFLYIKFPHNLNLLFLKRIFWLIFYFFTAIQLCVFTHTVMFYNWITFFCLQRVTMPSMC